MGASRRDVNRGTRPRWIYGGEYNGQLWDAFVTVQGCPLPDVVKQNGPLSWTAARMILEQLTDEIAAATDDGTLPSTLTVEKIWVLPNGGVQLLDFRVKEPLADGADRAPTEPMAFLSAAARLMVEGRPTTENASVPIRAPVPRHAAKLLARLVRLEPGYDVKEFAADLRATRHLPGEVTGTSRAAHLLLLIALLLPGLAMTFLMSLVLELVLPMVSFNVAYLCRSAARELEEGETREFILSNIRCDPFKRIGAATQFGVDTEEHKLLLEKEKQARAVHDARVTALSPQMRVIQRYIEAQVQTSSAEEKRVGFREEAERALSWQPWQDDSEGLPVYGYMLVFTVIWPIIWVVWAFVTRGGLSLRLTGLCLVRRNGQPALRVQCAWRALLVWLPMAALLATSLLLYAVYVAEWTTTPPAPAPWWTFVLSWWVALALALAYIPLALSFPSRGLHDRLAGTYLVPR
jgi:hypothetical protein